MNRIVLSHYIGEEAGMNKKQADQVLESIMFVITAALQKGGKVTISGFDTWSVVHKKARIGTIPSTGENISVAAKKVVKFTPSNLLNAKMEIVH